MSIRLSMSLNGLWSVFGPETPAGKQLRSILGNSKSGTVTQIKYPVLKSRSSAPAVPQMMPEKRTSQIQYPKFEKQASKPTPLNRTSTRRQLTAIRASISVENTAPNEPIRHSKNSSEEKKKLQEAFQFSSTSTKSRENFKLTISQESIPLPTIIASHNYTTIPTETKIKSCP
jgi:hypothetical protein